MIVKGESIFSKKHNMSNKLQLLHLIDSNDLLYMDSIDLLTIIGQGILPQEFNVLITNEPNTTERITTLAELRTKLSNDNDDDTNKIDLDKEMIENDDVDIVEIQKKTVEKDIKDETTTLPIVNILNDLNLLDSNLFSIMDAEAIEVLKQNKLKKLWNTILNNEISVDELKNHSGGRFFTEIVNEFFMEYYDVIKYKTPEGYSFKYEPNLMQKLCVYRLRTNKSYGNWSGTGAGKTLSFILSSREIESKITLVITLNSTVTQLKNDIKNVFPDSVVYTEYSENLSFDKTKSNYLILNYEKFQQEYSERLFQSLTNVNIIDFVVIDEVHNAKQRTDNNESIRRGVLNRLMGRIRDNNKNVSVLAMSATPVINNLFEAKSLLQLLTGLEFDDIQTRRTLPNAIRIFQQLLINGLRFIPKYNINITELTSSNMSNLDIDGTYLLDDLLKLNNNGDYVTLEKMLLNDKLISTKNYLKKGTIIYTYYTTDFVSNICNYIEKLGFTVGTYTGSEDSFIREENLNKFKNGDIDILIGSRPIGTGVDGLQSVCNRMILMTLPWTDAEYIQLLGRIYRQGSSFDNVDVIIPQVKIKLDNGDIWSWDIQRLNLIKTKRTLADCAVDGIIPSKTLPSMETLFNKSILGLKSWKDRISSGKILDGNREQITIDLYPELSGEQRQYSMDSELSEFNRRGKIMRSENMHDEFTKKPDSFFRYHALRKERMEQWDEIPYEYIATKIKNKNQIIADFGCGENKFKNCLPNKVYSFDHVSFDETVTACDMKNVPLNNESIDVALFSLSLWGSNYEDYIKEAYRTLNYGGIIYIAEPSKSYDTDELKNEFKSLLTRNGFEIVGDIENRGKFIYIKGLK